MPMSISLILYRHYQYLNASMNSISN